MSEIQTARGSFWVADQRKAGDPRPILLLIHGAGGSRLDWSGEIRRMPNVQVVLPDLAGHGKSATPARRTVAEYADDVLAICDSLAIDRALIGGHSLGGMIALQIALAHPERVCGLLLIGTGARLPVNPALLADLQTNPQEAKAKIMRWSAPPGTPADRIADMFRPLQETPADSIAAAFEAASSFDIRDRLPEIDIPALIVVGSSDVMAAPQHSELLLERMPHARLISIDGGGHRVINEQPIITAAAIQDWIDKVTCP